MSDKLTEIMVWKRREIAPMVRTVSEAELAQAHSASPQAPSFAAALRRPDGKLAIIAEISGIFSGADATRMRAAGAHAVLVGEALMKATDPAGLIADFHHV